MTSIRCHLLGCMSLILFVISLYTLVTDAKADEARDEAPWSEESNGLQARLSMRQSHVSNGTAIVAIYLELRNVSDVGNPMLITLNSRVMAFTVTDDEGQDAPKPTSIDYSGKTFGTSELSLPHDSSLRFRIGPNGMGIPADQAALVDLGPRDVWVLPRDGKSYYLQAMLEIGERKDNRADFGYLWNGRLELPRVRIPTEPEPVDQATIGPKIEELGALMLGKDGRKSDIAKRQLSLINDPRVIPWYVKAMRTSSSSLKFNALERLSRFEGDEALAGLKIGMATQGKDISNTSNFTLAVSSAENIRHSAAIALARSPHSEAKSLLWTMETDPATSVRITVVQAASREKTPESLELLKRRAKDSDDRVRGEAERLWKLREEDATK